MEKEKVHLNDIVDGTINESRYIFVAKGKKYYADKIIYFRVSYTNEKEIFKKIKPRTEDETKMRLYLK